jgi:hypothetical protein
MTSALGPDVLALLLPAVGADHPVTARALTALPDLVGTQREEVVAGLLEGPYATGSVPEPLADALGAEAADLARRSWADERLVARLVDVLGRYDHTTGERVPAGLADGAWNSAAGALRTTLLAHPGVAAEVKEEWLGDLDVPSLGSLLLPVNDPSPAAVELIIGEARSRTPADGTYTFERATEMAVPEVLLSQAPVSDAGFEPLVALLPRQPDWSAGQVREDRSLRMAWEDLVEWIARTQPHLWLAVDHGLLTRRMVCEEERAEKDGKKVTRTPEQAELFTHFMRVALAWRGSLTGVLDRLEDDDLVAVVNDELMAARQGHRLAVWWAGLPEGFDPAADGGAAGDAAFEEWTRVYDAELKLPQELTAEERATELEERRERMRWVWDDHVVGDGPEKNALSERASMVRHLASLLPLLTGTPQPPTRPRLPGEPPRARAYDYGHDLEVRRGWVASDEVREALRVEVRDTAHDLMLPNPPPVKEYVTRAWLEVAAAALSTPQDRETVPAQVLPGVRDLALEWQRRNGSRIGVRGSYDTSTSAAKLIEVTAPAQPTPRLVSASRLSLNSREAAREALDVLRADTSGPEGGPSVQALDVALDAAAVNSSLDVDEVLAVVSPHPGGAGVPGMADEVLTDAVAGLAGRLEAVLRERVRPLTAQARSQAAQSVLRSRHMSKEAVLALPAFAVFGAEARPVVNSPEAAVAAARLRGMLFELIDPTGKDQDAWVRLAGQDVANKGKDAWRSVRAVLADAGRRAG